MPKSPDITSRLLSFGMFQHSDMPIPAFANTDFRPVALQVTTQHPYGHE